MPDPWTAELDFATDVARRAGAVTLRWFGTELAVETKADATPVSIADREAERTIREAIAEQYPDDAILGEEYGEAAGAGSGRRLIVDPIDGTQSFIRGVPLYGTLVALEVDGAVVVGVAHFSALDETLAAARGAGCRHNGRLVRVSACDTLDDALVCYTDHVLFERAGCGDAWERVVAASGLVRGWSDCYGYALVATGRADAMLDPIMAAWDCAALAPIVEEAGGRFTDLAGESTIYGRSAIATNGRVHDTLVALVAGRTTVSD